MAFVSVIFISAYALSGLYNMRSRLRIAEEFSKVAIASSAGIMIVIIYIFLRQELFNSRFLVLGSWFFAIIFVWFGRLAIRYVQIITVSKYNFGVQKIIIIGEDKGATALVQKIKDDPTSGYRIVRQFPNLDLNEVREEILKSEINEVILTHPHYPEVQILELVDFCNENHIVFKYVPNISQLLTSNFSIDIFHGIPFIEIQRTSLDGWGKVIKRVVDVFGAFVGMMLLSPVFMIVAFAIKWETEGPVFVRLKRVSRNKEFDLLKFRSMIDNAHELNPYLRSVANDRANAGPLWKMKNDPRITKVGRLIRKVRFDEMPQFWNVLKGDMSLVGPRPHQSDEIANYLKHHKKVLTIKAGATGLAQVSGSSDIGFEQEVAIDSFYIDNWSLWLDFKIIIKTSLKMFFDKSAV